MYSSFSPENVLYSKHSVVPSERESLAEFVRRVRAERKLSLNDVRVQSGLQIATSYLNRIENGEVTNVSLEKLKALARGLGVAEDEVVAIARGKSPNVPEVFDSEIYIMFKGFEKLSDEDKAELLGTIRMLAAEVQRRLPKATSKQSGGKRKE